ncbi:glutamine-hydrolyzing carbamoyl-phosphate synthase small subunit [Candidatus Peregrinibacteria bacterium]|nr:glutamine-hydrolyzing carbamoyl-phosphate synthase small subunit [Candidatus Peregrinibacteria bacterium]
MPTFTPIKLILEDSSEYTGLSFGAEISSAGEVVFNTGMVGYPETFTDPSYRGQILVLTYPLIGNYGVPKNEKDAHGIEKQFESSRIHIKGLIVSDYSRNHHHWNAKKSLSEWLIEENIPAITGIDTRALTQKIREKGTMLGKIIPSKQNDLPFYDPNNENLVREVSRKQPKTYKKGEKSVILIDTGAKNNILRSLLARNITVHRVPWNYDFFQKKLKFDGIILSNGPGDPMAVKETHAISQIALGKKIPIFGICLGNQILAIAAGAKTYKLKYGHRSQNQPVKDLRTSRLYVTSQNHGFAVDAKTLPSDWEVWFENINDGTVEGIRHKSLPWSAVQFHPEATPGPVDTGFLFDEFIKTL